MGSFQTHPGEIKPRSWSDIFELGSKIVAALLGTFYVLGIVCVNAYVSGFGFTQYTLVESQYLFAGAWVAVLLTATSFPIVAAGALASKSGTGSGNTGQTILALLVLAIPFVLWYQILIHLAPPGGRFDAAVTSFLFVAVIGILIVTGFLLVAPLSPRVESTGRSWIKTRRKGLDHWARVFDGLVLLHLGFRSIHLPSDSQSPWRWQTHKSTGAPSTRGRKTSSDP